MQGPCPLEPRATAPPFQEAIVGTAQEAPAAAGPWSDPYVVAGAAVLALVVLALIYDVWALRSGGRTISQLLQHLSRWRTWFRVLGLGILAVFGWHVFFGFPW